MSNAVLSRRASFAIAFAMALSPPTLGFGQGIYLRAISSVNESMGGAATAAPLDSAGSLYWNPASIVGLQSSELTSNIGLLLPTTTLSSRINAGALGGGLPAVTLAGSDSSESGVSPLPDIAFVYKPDHSPLSFGFGVFGIGGFSENYSADPANPILSPQPPNGLGLGRISSDAELFQIIPTVAWHASDQWSFGVAPMLDLAKLAADPLFLAPPNDANHDGFATYGSGTGTRFAFGGGFQIGAYYVANPDWHFGGTLKSPQWFEDLRYKSADELGQPISARVRAELPLIISVGTAYYGLDNYVFAVDLRYFDYAKASGFNHAGFLPDGAVTGLGWQSIFALAAGVQRKLTEQLSVRIGYAYNDNPIANSVSQFNVASPLIIKHVIGMGLSYDLTKQCMVSLSYSHAFENQVTGPFVIPAGPIMGTSITSRVSSDDLNTQITVRF